MPGVSGVGISFGIDRLVDAMTTLNLFPEAVHEHTQILITNFGETFLSQNLKTLKKLRDSGVKAEFYADNVKLKKQLTYADNKGIKYALIIGEEEVQENVVSVKNLMEGTQEKWSLEPFIQFLTEEN